MTDYDLVAASLIGGAFGDAAGAPIEFATGAALDGWGLHAMGAPADFTDDTQMTLFTLEGLARADFRFAGRGVCDRVGVVHHALLRWLVTQGGEPQMPVDRDHGLIREPALHARMAPGLTCLSALERARRFHEAARNDSKGCGTIMRVAPVALLTPREMVETLAVETSALTHGHATGQRAAAAWAGMLADRAAGTALEDAARRALSAQAAMPEGREVAAAIRAALAAPRDGARRTVESLGAGWVAEECLAIALYACLFAEGLMGEGVAFARGIECAARHDGDSDSTAAVAGNMLGLMFPAAALDFGERRVPLAGKLFRPLLDAHRAIGRDGDEAAPEGLLAPW